FIIRASADIDAMPFVFSRVKNAVLPGLMGVQGASGRSPLVCFSLFGTFSLFADCKERKMYIY
ncbi:MAG: hypothetical protein IIZ91_03275, partial [Oscillospiraceae bacterium]|nr:hypothetical protein [Oscillospiraceae bacterium]